MALNPLPSQNTHTLGGQRMARPRLWHLVCIHQCSVTRRSLIPRSFEMAVVPCRTLCCGKLFCLEHLAEVRGPPPGAYSLRLIVTLLVAARFGFRWPMPDLLDALYH